MSHPLEKTKRTICQIGLIAGMLSCAGTCLAGQHTTFVRGFLGEPETGYNGQGYSHLGPVKMLVARQKGPDTRIEWRSAPLPSTIDTPNVTFVFTGAMGNQQSDQGRFSLWVNGRQAATFDVVVEPTRFIPASTDCEFLYNAIWADSTRCDSSGYCYLTVPGDWVRPGEPATLEVRAVDAGLEHRFGLIHAEDAPLSIPDRPWRMFVARSKGPANPPPAGQEASYEWYLPQFFDPGILTTIGPPGDPAETAVSPTGSLFYACDRGFEGAPQGYLRKAVAFALQEGAEIVPVGFGEPARQELADGDLPMVTTFWKHGPIEVRETALAEPLKKAPYVDGQERTLAWAALDVTNRGDAPRDLCLLGFYVGEEKDPRPDCQYREGAVVLNDSALFSAQAPTGFTGGVPPRIPRADRGDRAAGCPRSASPAQGCVQRAGGPRPTCPRSDVANPVQPGDQFPLDESLESPATALRSRRAS